jgi:acetoacetate decarboxylase
VTAYPPAPWELRGRVALIGVPVRVSAARAAGLPPGARVLSAGPWTLGGLLLADYDETATLAYRELIVFSALALAGGRPAFVVSHIYVDLEASLDGGRAIWGLPKQLARFTARDGRAAVDAADGAAARTTATGTLHGSPATAEVTIPAQSPLRALGLTGRHAAVAGDRLALPFPLPH